MARPLVCVSVAAPTLDELRRRRDEADDADLVELRLDAVRDPDVAGALADRRRPVIVTCRPRWEGGRFLGSEEERRSILRQALDHGAEYVDIEWRAGFDDLVRTRGGKGVVLSTHDFDTVPDDLPGRVQAMRATGAEIIKVAVRATRLSDCLPLLAIGSCGSGSARTALVAMGAAGAPTRILAARFGSCWTYAGENVAPGQIALDRLLREYRFRQISAQTDVYGIVGAPLAHSVSPAMHNAAFADAGVDAVYVPLEASDVDDFARFARALNVKGASITAPFKADMAAHMEETDPIARRAGVVNTLRVVGRRWVGANTDVPGFLAPLRGRFELAGARVAILGSGGAARAVAVALDSAGARVTVYGRNSLKVREVARLVGGEAGGTSPPRGSWDLLVNTTPVGTYPRVRETPLDRTLLDGRMVYDLVYNPVETRLMAEAKAAGCAAIGGLDMLVAQARLQVEWWIGRQPSEVLLRDAALRRLAEFQCNWSSNQPAEQAPAETHEADVL